MTSKRSTGHTIVVSALVVLLALFAPLAAAQDEATSVTYTILNTCSGGDFDLGINGTTIANLDGGVDCTCSPPLRTYTTTDAADLALVGDPGCTAPGVTQTGSNYISWIRAEITRASSGTETICIFDHNGGNCDVNNLCSAGYTSFTGQTFNANLPDSDGDGDADCTDTDDDNDGVLDSADNCPLDANPAQIDTDGNGVGNACDEFDDDADNDGIVDATDNCPVLPNPDQADSDGNGTGGGVEATKKGRRFVLHSGDVAIFYTCQLPDGQ